MVNNRSFCILMIVWMVFTNLCALNKNVEYGQDHVTIDELRIWCDIAEIRIVKKHFLVLRGGGEILDNTRLRQILQWNPKSLYKRVLARTV